MTRPLLFAIVMMTLPVCGIVTAQDVDFDPDHLRPEDFKYFKKIKADPVRTLNRPCLLVVNHVDSVSQIQISTHQDQRWPALYNFDRLSDSALCIEVYLPYEFPKRVSPDPIFRPPRGNFTLLIAYESDTAEYYISLAGDGPVLNVETVHEKGFVKLQQLLRLPEDVLLLRFDDYDQAKSAAHRLRRVAESLCLEPGYYEGVPCKIEKGEHKLNVCSLGVVLALKLPSDETQLRQTRGKLSSYDRLDG